MPTNPTTHSSLEMVDEASTWLVGGGIVTLALFPLALPAIVLLAIAALPLLLVAAVGAVVAGMIVVPVRLVGSALGALRNGNGPVKDSRVIESPRPVQC
jgi:hypothetical protein